MGLVRLLRTLAPLALIATFAAACGGSDSSSSAGGTPTDPASAATSAPLQVRPVTARYAPGLQFGPQLPKDLATQLRQQSCPMDPTTIEDQLLECGGKTVYLMKDPITSGGVASAVAKQIGHGKLWFVRVTLDPSTASTLDEATQSLSGTEVAYSFQGAVLTSVVVDSSFDTGRLAIIGDYDKAQATRLADELAQA